MTNLSHRLGCSSSRDPLNREASPFSKTSHQSQLSASASSFSPSFAALSDPFTQSIARASQVRAQVTPEPGNALTSAYDLGTLGQTPVVVTDSVSGTDPSDYYRFTLAGSGNFTLNVTGLEADADVHVLNSQGVTIATSEAAGTLSERITSNLDAGTYYVEVYQYLGITPYTLSLATTATTQALGFSSSSGYGLVNAAAAVASAINQPTFPDVPNLAGTNWAADLIHAPAVWAKGYTGQGEVVAVVDSGVDYTHPDLSSNIWTNSKEIPGNGVDDDRNGYVDDVHGWDFVSSDNSPLDENGHGTHVAGTIAAVRNGFGVTGIAYGAKIMPVRVLDSEGLGGYTDIATGIRYAVDNGANVINLSLGGDYSSTIAQAIQYAAAHNVVVAMAAGNESAAQPDYPAGFANQWGIAVGAVDKSDQLASFSNRAGTAPLNYVVAPGVDIDSTTPNNTYSRFQGTSMATPHVAAIAALMLSANPKLTAAQVVADLAGTAVHTGVTV